AGMAVAGGPAAAEAPRRARVLGDRQRGGAARLLAGHERGAHSDVGAYTPGSGATGRGSLTVNACTTAHPVPVPVSSVSARQRRHESHVQRPAAATTGIRRN